MGTSTRAAAAAEPARTGASPRGALVGTVTLGTARAPLDRDPRRAGPTSELAPTRVAWPPASAARAATDRWADRHRTVATATRVDAATLDDAARALDGAARQLAGSDLRRIDVCLRPGDPLLAHLTGPRWMAGRAGPWVVASRAIAYPWITPRPDPALPGWSRLPPSARRAVRRARSAAATPLSDLSATVAAEVSATLRQGQLPRRQRPTATDGAPQGSHPFAASRRNVVARALGLIDPDLRRSGLIDIGAGDGRVLRHALDLGFGSVSGREIDPALAAEAQRALGQAGVVEVGDALARPLPEGVGVVFLNNPFGDAGTAALAGLVRETLERRPRPLLVVFLNPPTIDPLLDAGLDLVEANPYFSVLAGGPRR